jgi:hypothetical protein
MTPGAAEEQKSSLVVAQFAQPEEAMTPVVAEELKSLPAAEQYAQPEEAAPRSAGSVVASGL